MFPPVVSHNNTSVKGVVGPGVCVAVEKQSPSVISFIFTVKFLWDVEVNVVLTLSSLDEVWESAVSSVNLFPAVAQSTVPHVTEPSLVIYTWPVKLVIVHW